jgi:hypothetical protein
LHGVHVSLSGRRSGLGHSKRRAALIGILPGHGVLLFESREAIGRHPGELHVGDGQLEAGAGLHQIGLRLAKARRPSWRTMLVCTAKPSRTWPTSRTWTVAPFTYFTGRSLSAATEQGQHHSADHGEGQPPPELWRELGMQTPKSGRADDPRRPALVSPQPAPDQPRGADPVGSVAHRGPPWPS